ncbi:hypothetical protein GUITHDRAFT_111117 [Guillardia theta CCMP2712]|uniref:Uncharacterized protein n=1 Tax=Guillardia theta (strain CCMP2712) TaxID=905079 RepID=L1J366_GUITC|nr:hypothetical protein GUITHDRAFT_111117 [Guillardia theta CCMP2712]EKX42747.1 hypothetical protein GUITHDRAFT_111117 [Guillardia theta CCMP2712]|eukprot:XP_005829727.1 hypothetical protein GUITHDRAFT_111117 [Guillardia theta CCMP2712]
MPGRKQASSDQQQTPQWCRALRSAADSRNVDIALHLAAMRMGGYLPSRTRIPDCIDDALKTSFVQHRPNRTSKVVMRRGKLGGSAFSGLEMMCSNGGIELALTSITFRRTLADRHAMEIAVEHLSIAVREGLEGVVAKMVDCKTLSCDWSESVLRRHRIYWQKRSASMHMAREDAHDKVSGFTGRRGRNEVLMRRVDESAQTRNVGSEQYEGLMADVTLVHPYIGSSADLIDGFTGRSAQREAAQSHTKHKPEKNQHCWHPDAAAPAQARSRADKQPKGQAIKQQAAGACRRKKIP